MKTEIGNKFGKLLALNKEKDKNGYYTRYKCLCDCGNIHIVSTTHLRAGRITHCGCERSFGAKHSLWAGIGEISSAFWYDKIIRSASGVKGNRRIKKVTITIEEAWNLFLKQERKCALTGIILIFPNKSKGSYTASLDRIDSSKDYTLDNVQWVHKDINIMKNKFDNQYFIDMCKKVAACTVD